MAKPVPLAVWDRRDSQVHTDWMDDGQSHYESRPRRSPMQWLESQPAYDWFYAALQNSRWSRRKIAPFIEKHRIDMTQFELENYQSYNEFFIRNSARVCVSFLPIPAKWARSPKHDTSD